MNTRNLSLMMSLLAISFFFFATAQIQSESDFEGTWQLEIAGTPYGDVTLMLEVKRNEESLSGNIVIEQGEATVQNIIERDNRLIVYWVTGQYDLDMSLTLVDKDHLDGWIAGSLRVSGIRVSD